MFELKLILFNDFNSPCLLWLKGIVTDCMYF